jgi:hypothetical protein
MNLGDRMRQAMEEVRVAPQRAVREPESPALRVAVFDADECLRPRCSKTRHAARRDIRLRLRAKADT